MKGKEESNLNLVYISITAWLTIIVFSLLPRKVSRITNVLVFFVSSIVDINKLTLNISTFSLIKPNLTYTNWLAIVVYRDVTMSFLLLIFINVYFTATDHFRKWLVTLLSFLLLAAGSQVLRVLQILQYTNWTIYYEILCILGLMGITYVTARWSYTRNDGERL